MQGNYGPAEQDGHGDRRLYAERALGPDRLRQGRRHGRRRHVGGDAAGGGRRRALAGRALGHRQDYPSPGCASRRCATPCSSSARKSTAQMDAEETLEKIGQGVLQAAAALAVRPPAVGKLTRTAAGRGVVAVAQHDLRRRREPRAAGTPRSAAPCSTLELTQMAQRSPRSRAIAIPIGRTRKVSAGRTQPLPRGGARQRQPVAATAGGAGEALRSGARRLRQRRTPPRPPHQAQGRDAAAAGAPAARLRARPKHREERSTFRQRSTRRPWLVPMGRHGQDAPLLQPGPVGEYLEVVDIDPASEQGLRAGRPQRQGAAGAGRLAAVRGQPAIPPADGLRRRHDDHRPFRAGARPQGAVGAAPAAGRTRRATTTRCRGCASIRTRSAPPTPITARRRRRCCSATFPRSPRRRRDGAGQHGVHLPLQRHHRARDVARPPRRPASPASRRPRTRTCAPSTRRFADIVAVFQHFTIPELVQLRDRPGAAATCRRRRPAGRPRPAVRRRQQPRRRAARLQRPGEPQARPTRHQRGP